MRYWLGGGRGGFSISPSECVAPSFYAIVTAPKEGGPDYMEGVRVKSSPVPIKDALFASIKSNNYLPNVLCAMDAEAEGCDVVRNQHP